MHSGGCDLDDQSGSNQAHERLYKAHMDNIAASYTRVALLFSLSGISRFAAHTVACAADRALLAAALQPFDPCNSLPCVMIASVGSTQTLSELVPMSRLDARAIHNALRSLENMQAHEDKQQPSDGLLQRISPQIERSSALVLICSTAQLMQESMESLYSFDDHARHHGTAVHLLPLPPDFDAQNDRNGPGGEIAADIDTLISRIAQMKLSLQVTPVVPTAAHIETSMRSLLTHRLLKTSHVSAIAIELADSMHSLRIALSTSTLLATLTRCVNPLQSDTKFLPRCDDHQMPVEEADSETKNSLAFCQVTGEPVDMRWCKREGDDNAESHPISVCLGRGASIHLPSFIDKSRLNRWHTQEGRAGSNSTPTITINECVKQDMLSEALTFGQAFILLSNGVNGNSNGEGDAFEQLCKALSQRRFALLATSTFDINSQTCAQTSMYMYMLLPMSSPGLLLKRYASDDEAVDPLTNCTIENDQNAPSSLVHALDGTVCETLPARPSGVDALYPLLEQSISISKRGYKQYSSKKKEEDTDKDVDRLEEMRGNNTTYPKHTSKKKRNKSGKRSLGSEIRRSQPVSPGQK